MTNKEKFNIIYKHFAKPIADITQNIEINSNKVLY